MDKKELRRISPGFYVDAKRSLYFDVHEFLAAQRLPDSAEVRKAVWDQVRRDFGPIAIEAISDIEEQ